MLILVAFVLSVLGRLSQASYRYLVANAVGSAALAASAIVSVQWGFIVLEGVWAVVSVVSIVRKLNGAQLHP
jgi:hypothetical protein